MYEIVSLKFLNKFQIMSNSNQSKTDAYMDHTCQHVLAAKTNLMLLFDVLFHKFYAFNIFLELHHKFNVQIMLINSNKILIWHQDCALAVETTRMFQTCRSKQSARKTLFKFSNALKFNFCAIFDGNAASDPVLHSRNVTTVKNCAAISRALQRAAESVGHKVSDLYHKRHESSIIRNEMKTPVVGKKR